MTTVRELIEKLQKLDQGLDIFVGCDYDSDGPREIIKPRDIVVELEEFDYVGETDAKNPVEAYVIREKSDSRHR